MVVKQDVVCKRIDGVAFCNIEHTIVKHSPTGMEWGYAGSGPADLALNILSAFVGRKHAERGGVYQKFKRAFIAGMPDEGGTIKAIDIENWIQEHIPWAIEIDQTAAEEGI